MRTWIAMGILTLLLTGYTIYCINSEAEGSKNKKLTLYNCSGEPIRVWTGNIGRVSIDRSSGGKIEFRIDGNLVQVMGTAVYEEGVEERFEEGP